MKKQQFPLFLKSMKLMSQMMRDIIITSCELISTLHLTLNYHFAILHDNWFIISSSIIRLVTYIFLYLHTYFQQRVSPPSSMDYFNDQPGEKGPSKLKKQSGEKVFLNDDFNTYSVDCFLNILLVPFLPVGWTV